MTRTVRYKRGDGMRIVRFFVAFFGAIWIGYSWWLVLCSFFGIWAGLAWATHLHRKARGR